MADYHKTVHWIVLNWNKSAVDNHSLVRLCLIEFLFERGG